MKEVWKSIKGFPDYKVSNLASIKSLSRLARYKNTHRKLKEKILRQTISTTGYPNVQLRCVFLKKTMKVHRLIAQAFIPNPENKPQVILLFLFILAITIGWLTSCNSVRNYNKSHVAKFR